MMVRVLELSGVGANGGGLDAVAVLPCTDGSGVVPPPGPISVSVHVVPLILKQDPAILMV